MNPANQAGGGAPADHQSGAPVENDGQPSSKDSRSDADPKPDLQRALDDMHRFKREAREAAQKLADAQALLESERKAKLREKEDWKSLAETEAKRAKELEDKFTRVNHAYTNTQKFSHVHAAAIKAGLRPEAERDLELLALDDVNVEMTTEGRFLVSGHDSFVEGLKKQRPHWFQNTTPPSFNPGGGRPSGVIGGELSFKDVMAIEKKHGRNSKEYKDVAEKWQKSLIEKKSSR